MRESTVRGAAIDINDFERRLRGVEPPRKSSGDPLSELARLMQRRRAGSSGAALRPDVRGGIRAVHRMGRGRFAKGAGRRRLRRRVARVRSRGFSTNAARPAPLRSLEPIPASIPPTVRRLEEISPPPPISRRAISPRVPDRKRVPPLRTPQTPGPRISGPIQATTSWRMTSATTTRTQARPRRLHPLAALARRRRRRLARLQSPRLGLRQARRRDRRSRNRRHQRAGRSGQGSPGRERGDASVDKPEAAVLDRHENAPVKRVVSHQEQAVEPKVESRANHNGAGQHGRGWRSGLVRGGAAEENQDRIRAAGRQFDHERRSPASGGEGRWRRLARRRRETRVDHAGDASEAQRHAARG